MGRLTARGRRLIDLGDGRIVVLWRGQASGRGSGVPVDFDGAYLFDISGGQVIRENIFLGRRQPSTLQACPRHHAIDFVDGRRPDLEDRLAGSDLLTSDFRGVSLSTLTTLVSGAQR